MLAGLLVPLAHYLLNQAHGGVPLTPEDYHERWEKARIKADDVLCGPEKKRKVKRILRSVKARAITEPLLSRFGQEEENGRLLSQVLNDIDNNCDCSMLLCEIFLVLSLCDERDDEEAMMILVLTT
jgi:hypothetical protein